MQTTATATPTWQTPTAIDFRFGFEITLYIAAR
jgi:coenzyme PQQ precursor peptide PqqA